MPVQSCRDNGKPGFKWGTEGKCYTYRANDESSRQRARAAAERQGRAVEANRTKGKQNGQEKSSEKKETSKEG